MGPYSRMQQQAISPSLRQRSSPTRQQHRRLMAISLQQPQQRPQQLHSKHHPQHQQRMTMHRHPPQHRLSSLREQLTALLRRRTVWLLWRFEVVVLFCGTVLRSLDGHTSWQRPTVRPCVHLPLTFTP